MPNYVLAIDGGGTKTLGVLYDEKGQEIDRVIEGFANFSVNVPKSKQHIEQTIMTLLKSVPQDATCTIQCGIAGISGLDDIKDYETTLSKTFSTAVSLESDALIALYAAAENLDDYVLMAIGGTGSVVMVKTESSHHQLGGHGHLLGDEGSAYHVVIAAIKQLIDDIELKRHLSTLSTALLNHLNTNDLDGIKQFIYSNTKNDIASLSQVVAEAALSGDETAIALLKYEGELLAKQILRAVNTYPTTQIITIALHGGFIKQAPYVKETIIKLLASSLDNFTIKEHSEEAVYGAYVLAKAKGI